MKKVRFVIIVVIALLAFTACNAPGSSINTTSGEQTADTEVTPIPALKDVVEETNEETAGTNSDTRTSASGNANETEEAAASVSRTGEEEPVIIYEREGGLKGIGPSRYVWHIYADGRVTSSQDQSWQVAPEEIADLLTNLNVANLRSLNSNYVPEDTCCDRAQHTITIQADGQTYKFTTLDGVDLPEALTNTLDTINAFLMDLQ